MTEFCSGESFDDDTLHCVLHHNINVLCWSRFIMQLISIQQDIWSSGRWMLLTVYFVLSSDRETLDPMVLLEETVLLESR